MRLLNVYSIVAVFASLCMIVNCYKILGVFPTMAKSHFIIGSSLMKGLVEKGHEVTMLSPFPQSKPLKNWRDIPTPALIQKTQGIMDNILHLRNNTILESIVSLFDMGVFLTNLTMQEPAVQEFLRSKEKFDVVIVEAFVNEAHLGFAHAFGAPVIAISTFGSNMWVNEMVGSPAPLSYVPHPLTPLTDKMNFIQRLSNVVLTIVDRLYYQFIYMPKQKQIYSTMFPDPQKPCLDELRKNVSLVLLNSHFSVGSPKPYVPNMIEVGGMHINRKPKPLPADIKKFIDEAKDGVIYFSMGSNLKSKILPLSVRQSLIKTFSGLKQRVLWKFEDKDLPGKPNNVLISDWFPQDDILAHPNVKLFITHGGLLSTMEAIYHGVPIIGIPIFGDQFLNMAKAEKAKFGIAVDYESLNEITLGAAIKKMLITNQYQLNIKEISNRYKDQPMLPLDTATYWVEYVARHKGAEHLKSSGQELNFIQYHNIDSFGLIFFVIYLMYLINMAIVRKMFSFCCSSNKKEEKKTKASPKKKKN